METPIPQKRALKPFISSRSIRGYLLERRECLQLNPNERHLFLIEAIEALLAAYESGEVAL